jgi:opacity protein-like surface antigen
MRWSGWARMVGAIGALALVLATSGPAIGAEPDIRRGSLNVGMVAGGSFSHDLPVGLTETAVGFDLLPHVGLVLTDQHGSGWLRGNLELLAEPTVIDLSNDHAHSTLVGLAAMTRWLFVGTGAVRPYVEAGAGILGGKTDLQATRCDLNFVLQAGPGVLIFLTDTTALTAGYRFQHISNKDECIDNLGLNSSLFLIGLSYFFP